MPVYRFRIDNEPSEEHVMPLPNDKLAMTEALRTAAGMVTDLSLDRIGTEMHRVEITEMSEDNVDPVLQIEIRTVRTR